MAPKMPERMKIQGTKNLEREGGREGGGGRRRRREGGEEEEEGGREGREREEWRRRPNLQGV